MFLYQNRLESTTAMCASGEAPFVSQVELFVNFCCLVLDFLKNRELNTLVLEKDLERRLQKRNFATSNTDVIFVLFYE